MFKIFSIALWLLFLLFSVSFSANLTFKRSTGNCNKENIEYYENLLQDWRIFNGKKIITKDVYEKSLENLKKYCNNENDVLSSDIFWNHLLDVWFRKIDWIKWAAYWIKLDPLWEKYREALNEIEKEYVTDPEKIKKLFETAWGSPDENIEANNNTLYWKYKLVCKELESISDKVLTARGKDNKTQLLDNAYYVKTCYYLADRRYANEMWLVIWIIRQNLYNYAEKWMYKKVNQEFTKKIWDMFNSLMQTLGLLNYVARRFMHATDVQTR